jgi:hypothetical protein
MKFHVAFLLIIISQTSFAQLHLPELSPMGIIEQTVGYTEFGIRYGRPAARERKIMGGLVPFNKLWRTGGGECTTISFDHEVVINGKSVLAGAYALVTIPDEKNWTIMLNSDTSKRYGDPSEYDPATEVVRLNTQSQKSDRFYESLTIELDIKRNDAILHLSWENTRISFSIATGSHEKALVAIRHALDSAPRDPEILARASFYYTMNNEDPEQALKWLDVAIANGGERWVYFQKFDLLARLKKYPEARKAARDGIAFLKRTKPQEWDGEISTYEGMMKAWPNE